MPHRHVTAVLSELLTPELLIVLLRSHGHAAIYLQHLSGDIGCEV